MKKITLLFMLLTASLGFAQPTTDAPTPTNGSADVFSIYSDAYTNIATNYNPGWGQTGAVNTTYDPTSGGTNFVMAYTNFNYQGTELTTQNASGMEFLHVDIWTAANPGATTIQVTPINNGTGASETLVTINYTSGTWTSVDIPKADFTGMTWDSVYQMKFAANGAGSTVPVDIYLDNVYFWKAPLAAGSDATLSDLQIDGTTISGFSPSVFNYTVDLVVGTTTAPQITLATPTDPAATSVTIIDATAVPGDATVEVVSQNGNVTETYTVSFTATLPNASSTPANYTTHLALLSDITDTSAFTNFWNPSYYFGSNQGTPDLDETAGVNKAVKMDFSVEGWGGGIFNVVDITTDVSANDMVHIDYFVPNAAAGVSGHAFYLDLISRTGGVNTEVFYNFAPSGGDATIVFDAWQSVDIPLSALTGFDTANFFQFKIGSPSDLNTKVAYFDNLYFYDSATLGTNEFETSEFNVYPNPSNNVWNVKTNNTIINSIQVFDVLGKQVLSLNPNSAEAKIDASSLNTGLFFARIESNSGIKTIKLIKN